MTPATEAEVAEAIRGANGPLTVTGGGTRAPLAEPGEALSTTGLTGITLYEPGALTLVARAGTPMAEIDAALKAEGQRLAFEPWDASAVLGRKGTPTVGGAVATNASGPRRVVSGACRDALIGVRFVDGTGAVVKNGGRVMKNVTGTDLTKLMAGSRGTLGVLTEVAFKLLPGVETSATLACHGLTPQAAVEAMSAALGSPFEPTGAAHDGTSGETWIRVEGFEDSVAYRAGQLRQRLSPFGGWEVVDDDGLWPWIRDARRFAGGQGDLWRISVRASAAPGVVDRLPGRWFLDWGGGLIWAEAPAGHDLRAELADGDATLVRASAEAHRRLGTLPKPHPGARRIAEEIRRRFDPRGLFTQSEAVA